MKKILVGAILLMFLLSFNQVASANENFEVTSSSAVFMSYGSAIDLSSGYIRANSYSNLTGFYNLSIDMKLQRYNGISWTTVTSWHASDYNMTLDLRKSYPATSGTYRVLSIHTAGGESKISYSPTLIVQ